MQELRIQISSAKRIGSKTGKACPCRKDLFDSLSWRGQAIIIFATLGAARTSSISCLDEKCISRTVSFWMVCCPLLKYVAKRHDSLIETPCNCAGGLDTFGNKYCVVHNSNLKKALYFPIADEEITNFTGQCKSSSHMRRRTAALVIGMIMIRSGLSKEDCEGLLEDIFMWVGGEGIDDYTADLPTFIASNFEFVPLPGLFRKFREFHPL